jgi:hypothetical protein
VAALGFGDIAGVITVSGAALLVLAAGAKLRAAQPTAQVLRQLGLPAPAFAVPLIAGSELVAAVLAPFGGFAAWPLALVYAGFAVTGLRLLVSAPGASCGCFGSAQTPVTALHPVLTAVVAAAAATGPWTATGWRLLRPDQVSGLVLIAQTAVLSALLYAALAVYPQLVASTRTSSSTSPREVAL